GLLIIGVGRGATKRLDEFKGMEKEYIAEITLGATSDTQDKTGTLISGNTDILPSLEEISTVVSSFIGKQTQIPPMFSAKKVKGKKLYELARKGEEIEREPVSIEIYDIELMSYHYPTLQVRIQVSTGTYIRTLAYDIGEKLGTGAYCHELRRTKIGKYLVENAKDPKTITEKDIFAV
ncbi:MAG: tRNA pseudouridine(55) synthase TruB, partial [Candidatus Magasanikbacteria bacterium]